MVGIRCRDPVPSARHLGDSRLDLTFNQRFSRLGKEEAQHLGLETIDGIGGRSGIIGEGDEKGFDGRFRCHARADYNIGPYGDQRRMREAPKVQWCAPPVLD